MNVAVAKLLFLGPSLQGKTVTRKRLTKMITNLSLDPSDDMSNTGISEQTTVITCKNLHQGVILAAEEGDDWKVVEDIEQEVEMFIHTESMQKSKSDPSDCHVESTQKYIPNETLKPEHCSEQISLGSTAEKVPSSSPSSVHPEIETHGLAPTSSKLSAEPVHLSAESIFHFLQKKKTYNLSEIKLHLNNGCMIYLQDTGGQPELMDCLPALTIGPALYLLFCKLNTSLDDHYTIGYRGTDGETTSSLLSHFTIKETLLSALVSISSMIYSASDDRANIEQQAENRRQCVYIVGTHRDKVEDSSIDAFEMNLQESMHSTFFHKKGLIKEWYRADFPADSTLRDIPKRLVYPLNNQDGGIEEIQCLRKALSEKINQYAKKVIPSQWLIFSIVLRGRPEVVLTLETCYTIGRCLNMNKRQTEAALHFLHYNLGTCMHFSNIEGLKHVVITNTQAIYQSLTKIIEAAFKPGIVHEAAASEFKNTGQFSLECFSRQVDTPLPLEILLIVLEHLNIIAPIPSANREETMYFMPCILPNASDTDIVTYEEDKMPHEVSPLYIRYDCGFVPMGVFSATVANLIQQSSKNVSLRFLNNTFAMLFLFFFF